MSTIAEKVLLGEAGGESSASMVIGQATAVREPALALFADGSAIVGADPVKPGRLEEILPLPGTVSDATVFAQGPDLDPGARLAAGLLRLGWRVTIRIA